MGGAKVKTVAIPEGFSHEIGIYVSGLDYGREQTRALIADLTPAEIANRIAPEFHSIGALALHLAEAEFFWMCEVVGGKAPSADEARYFHVLDTMEADRNRGHDAEYLISRLDSAATRTREVLLRLTDDDLERQYSRNDLPADVRHDLREILQRLIDHEANHRGQIAMIKRVVRGEKSAS